MPIFVIKEITGTLLKIRKNRKFDKCIRKKEVEI